jgi:hypothetical protein
VTPDTDHLEGTRWNHLLPINGNEREFADPSQNCDTLLARPFRPAQYCRLSDDPYSIARDLDLGPTIGVTRRDRKEVRRTVPGWMPGCEQVQNAGFFSTNPAVQAGVVRGVLLNDDDPYIVKANDGTIYKAEWYGGDSSWSHGDRAILTNDNGQGQMVFPDDDDEMSEVWVEEVDE